MTITVCFKAFFLQLVTEITNFDYFWAGASLDTEYTIVVASGEKEPDGRIKCPVSMIIGQLL
jgi:hypothetical protein